MNGDLVTAAPRRDDSRALVPEFDDSIVFGAEISRALDLAICPDEVTPADGVREQATAAVSGPGDCMGGTDPRAGEAFLSDKEW